MKSRKSIFILIITIATCSTFDALHALSDDSVVDSITAYSDLTQADADRWKLLWLGSLSEPAAAAASAYGVYRAGKAAKGFTPTQQKLNNIFASQIYSSILNRPSETMQNIVTSKWTWAGAGALGAGFAAYKLLYPRVQVGLLDKIENYISLCGRLAVAQQAYYDVSSFNRALQQPGNTVWVVSSPIAKSYGFKNLIEQGNVALLLVDQLLKNGGDFDVKDVEAKRSGIITFKNNLEHNQRFIQSEVQAELQRRAQQRSEYGKELDIQGKEVGIAGKRIKTLKNQFELLKDIAKTTKYVVEEYGAPLAVAAGFGVAVSKVHSWFNPVQPINFQPPVEQ